MPIAKGNIPVKKYYQDKEVVEQYLKKRFLMPLRQIHHEKQVDFINEIIRNLNDKSKILEIALGPARLAIEVDVNKECERFALDFSKEMLKTAKKRLVHANLYEYWNLINSDAFKLPFRDETFDFVYTFRLIRHLGLAERKEIYSEINRVLKKTGMLVFDAQNYNISYPHRVREGLENYPVYDVLYQREELISELEDQGWDIDLKGVMCRFNLQELIQKILLKLRINNEIIKKVLYLLENGSPKNPSEWIVLCQKR